MFIKRYFEKSEKPQIVRLGLQHRTNGRLLYRLYKKFKTQEGKSIIPKKSGQNTFHRREILLAAKSCFKPY